MHGYIIEKETGEYIQMNGPDDLTGWGGIWWEWAEWPYVFANHDEAKEVKEKNRLSGKIIPIQMFKMI